MLAAGQQTGGSNNPATVIYVSGVVYTLTRINTHTHTRTHIGGHERGVCASANLRIAHSACIALTVNPRIGRGGGCGNGGRGRPTFMGSRRKNPFVGHRRTDRPTDRLSHDADELMTNICARAYSRNVNKVVTCGRA